MNAKSYKKIKTYAVKQWEDPVQRSILLHKYRHYDTYLEACKKEWKRANCNERKKLCPK